VHCSVFVLRPLPESARLVEEKEMIVAHVPLNEYLKYAGGELPDELVETDDGSVGEVVFDLPLDKELPEKLAEAGVVLSKSEKDRLRILAQDGIPIRSRQPELRPECARLLAAEAVIINLHDDRERARGEATRVQILNLFSNWHLRYSSDSVHGSPGPEFTWPTSWIAAIRARRRPWPRSSASSAAAEHALATAKTVSASSNETPCFLTSVVVESKACLGRYVSSIASYVAHFH
jgi:hypothetical protein